MQISEDLAYEIQDRLTQALSDQMNNMVRAREEGNQKRTLYWYYQQSKTQDTLNNFYTELRKEGVAL